MASGLSDSERQLRAIVSLKTMAGAYPSVSRHHLPALRLERAMRDLYGTARQACPIPGLARPRALAGS
jgi:Ni,Fe-hydrogenase III component G